MNTNPNNAIQPVRPRGRKPANPALSMLAQWARKNLSFESPKGEKEQIEDSANFDGVVRGCFQFPDERGKADAPWSVKFFLAGKQWMLGRYPLYTAARLYDACVVYFSKYRTTKIGEENEGTWLNFSIELAKGDIEHNENLKTFLSSLEGLAKQEGGLTTREERDVATAQSKKERNHKRTIAGHLDEGFEEFKLMVFDLIGMIETVQKTQAKILSLLKPPGTPDRFLELIPGARGQMTLKVIPDQPAGPTGNVGCSCAGAVGERSGYDPGHEGDPAPVQLPTDAFVGEREVVIDKTGKLQDPETKLWG